jgi:hypothetical protein
VCDDDDDGGSGGDNSRTLLFIKKIKKVNGNFILVFKKRE